MTRKALTVDARTYPSLAAFIKAHPELLEHHLARELGISKAYLSQIKWGTRQPPLRLALRIAERCRIPLESLLRKAS